MINQLIDGISIKLNQQFGDSYEIYSEDVSQGLKEPCFFIKFLNFGQTFRRGNRYYREHFFDVHYFPSTPNKNSEINTVSEQLLDALEYIDVNGDLFRGTKMNHETVNEVLHFFVNYNFHVYKVGDEIIDIMEGVEVDNGLKG